MKNRTTQPRRARIALIGFAAAALSFVAAPQAVNAAAYPPAPDGETSPPPPDGESSPPSAEPQGVAGAGAGSLPSTGGSDPSQIVWIALSSIGAGGLIYAASFRRRGAEKIAS